jgi:hypothetical protein
MLANFGIGTLAHDPEKACPGHDPGLPDFSDKIMRKGKKSMILSLKIGPP